MINGTLLIRNFNFCFGSVLYVIVKMLDKMVVNEFHILFIEVKCTVNYYLSVCFHLLLLNHLYSHQPNFLCQ